MNVQTRAQAAWWTGLTALGLAALLSSASCDPAESFSDTPEIAPLRVERRDSITPGNVRLSQVDVTISWKDGNGDLGYITGDNRPEDLNYFITIEKKKTVSGTPTFVEVVPPTTSSTGFNGRFVNLNPDGQSSTRPYKLRGELKYRVNGTGFTVLPPSVIGTVNGVNETVRAGDVLRFKIFIKDRAGNSSNQITTEEVTL